jgi:hypothetical protein
VPDARELTAALLAALDEMMDRSPGTRSERRTRR